MCFFVTSPVEGPADGPTVSPTRGAPEDDTTSNSPTQVAPVDDTTSTNPTQVAPVDDTTTNSPTQTNNPIDLETRSTVVLSGFRISLSAEEEKSVDDTALSTVVTQYLREDLEKLDGFLDVRLVVMNEDMTGQTGRQAQPYESRMFFGEAFFAGDAPEDSAVLEIQGAALNDNTRMQKALSDGGVDAVLIKTEIYGKETIGTEDPATSAVGILHYSFWFSLIATAASLAAAV